MKLDDCRGFHDAVNEACTCGGGGPPDCCPACEVYHAVKDWEVAGPAAQPRDQPPEVAAVALMRRVVARTMEVTTDGDLCLPRWGKHTEFLAAVRSFMEMTAALADSGTEGGR